MKNPPLPRQAPGDTPVPLEPERPQRAPGEPGQPDTIEAPPPPDPALPPDSDVDGGAIGVGADEAHVGATEEQVGDRTGPGAGYDQKRR
jgi:hypothetical protein